MDKKIVVRSKEIIKKETSQETLIELLLENRNIRNDDRDDFLKPPFPTFSQVDLEAAKQRIKKAIDEKEEILIYGDYDVDGITSTSIIWQTLFIKGAKVTPFVPDREHDGYGVKAKSFFDFEKERGVHFDLLITVDNGIVAHQEIEKIQNNNTDVIIVDHHEALEEKPKGAIIVHTRELSGSGLSWFLARELDENADLGLAALGTVADCMPLLKTNRSLVVAGIADLRLNPSPGIKKLMEVAGCRQDSIDAYDLGFVLGPRINAIGRLSNPTDALRLLCSQSSVQASKYAKTLDQFNRDRQGLQKEHIEIAEKMVKTGEKIIVVASEQFNPGIIGLIAGRLTEKYHLPSVVMAINGTVAKGSCRSIPQLNIIETLRKFPELFVDLGGHAAAAGFTVKKKDIKKLQKSLEKVVGDNLAKADLEPSIEVDAEMEISAVNMNTIGTIKKMEPFGMGNPNPVFYFRGLKIVSKKTIGSSGDHLKLKVDDPRTAKVEYLATDAIAFKKGEMASNLDTGDLIDVVASLDSNTWQGVTTPQLVVKEIIKTAGR